MVVYLSGAHGYGFPSPDSDLDLKAIHIAPARALLGFEPPVLTFDRAEVIDDVENDYTSNELANVLAGILQGNGNFLERVLGRTAFTASSLLDAWRPRLASALAALDEAFTKSVLPEEPPNAAALETWLVEARLRRLD